MFHSVGLENMDIYNNQNNGTPETSQVSAQASTSVVAKRRARLPKDPSKLRQPKAFSPPSRTKLCGSPTTRMDRVAEKSDSCPTSYFFIERPMGQIYRLDFQTQNVNIQTMYVFPRRAIPGENEKSIQPASKEHLKSQYNLAMTRMGTLTRTYKLVDDQAEKSAEEPEGDDVSSNKSRGNSAPPSLKNTPTLSPSGSRSGTPTSLMVYKDDQFKEQDTNISRVKRSNTDGAIYVEHNGYILKLRTEMTKLTSLRPPADKDIQDKLEKLHMEPTAKRKNKGELWCRCGNDLLRIQFSMGDVSLTKVELKEEVGLQTVSNLIYIRDSSTITGNTNYISVPESTYIYEDPMPAIHRVHLKFMRANAMPLWKYQMMQSRLAASKGVNTVQDIHEKLFNRTRGSRILFEAFDALAGVSMGMMCSEVLRGKQAYEDARREDWLNELNTKSNNNVMMRWSLGGRSTSVTSSNTWTPPSTPIHQLKSLQSSTF